MAIIEQAAAEEPGLRAAPRRAADAKVFSSGTKTIEQIAAAHRLRIPEPSCGGRLALDVVRADRDSR
jgi:hypothetical protein